MAGAESDVTETFHKAAAFVKTVAGKLDSTTLLNLYARFKQVLVNLIQKKGWHA